MKYRVPINTTESVIEHLKSLKLDKKAEFAKSEKVTREKAKELRGKVNDLNHRLENVKKGLTKLTAQRLQELKDEIEEALSLNSIIFDSGPQSLLEEYKRSLESTNEAAKEGNCVENLSKEFDSVMEGDSGLKTTLEKCYSEVNSTLAKIGPVMKEIQDLKREIRSLKKDREENEDEIKELEDEIDDLESLIDEEVYELKDKLDNQLLVELELEDETINVPKINSQGFIEFIKKTEEAVKNKLAAQIEREWLISIEEFKERGIIADEFLDAGDMYVEPQSNIGESEAEKRNDVILKNLDKLARVVNDTVSNTVEKMYLIEYVMDKYTFLTSKTDRAHYFKKGEIEYILAGNDVGTPYDIFNNTECLIITKVLFQVWAMRFTIDFIDNFVNSTVVFPPQRLAFALLEGALDSSMDVCSLLNGEAIPLCPKSFTAVKLKYSDHLRILLFMKPEEEILRKARQLMQINIKQVADSRGHRSREGFKLGDYSTMIRAEVEARLNLFFLPLIKADKLLPEHFDGGRYIIKKQIISGY
jgi:predicted  nucleic acid-binding Zn-ribbon protein